MSVAWLLAGMKTEEGAAGIRIKSCDIGYALATNSCEGVCSVDACTVAAPDAITAFTVPNPGCSSRGSRFFRVWWLNELPRQTDHPAYFGSVNVTWTSPFSRRQLHYYSCQIGNAVTPITHLMKKRLLEPCGMTLGPNSLRASTFAVARYRDCYRPRGFYKRLLQDRTTGPALPPQSTAVRRVENE